MLNIRLRKVPYMRFHGTLATLDVGLDPTKLNNVWG